MFTSAGRRNQEMDDNETEPLKGHSLGAIQYTKENLNNSINTKKDDEFSLSKIPRQRKVLLASMALVNFLSVTGFALLAPFFPAEAKKKGASQTVVGMIFGVFEFVVFLSSPILGNYITKVGSKFMYLSGTMIGGICGILFGVLDKSPDGTIYIVMCFLCRTIEAFGCSMFVTASFAIIASVFPDNVTTVFGVLETFSGLGMIAGPAVGGALYQLGGFGLPFFVVGSITVTNGVLGYFLIGHIDGGGIYTFTAPLWGFIIDKKGYVKSMIAVGNLVGAVGFLLMGPTPLIDQLPFKLWSLILSLMLMGLGLGCAIIPTFRGLIDSAKALGMEENMDTHGMVSGLFNSCFSLGAFIGPTVGGALADKLGFDWSATICAGLITLSVIFIAIYKILKTWNEKDTEVPSKDTNQSQ